MVTGDNKITAIAIAKECGIRERRMCLHGGSRILRFCWWSYRQRDWRISSHYGKGQ